MRKKGFTLIELLAVIIILAIIALIATPIVMRIIENSKKGAAERSAQNYARAVETELMVLKANGTIIEDGNYSIKSNGNLCLDDECEKELVINMNGNKLSGGRVQIENWKITAYTIIINGDENAYGFFTTPPKEYQQVEYLASTGEQFILTGVPYLNTTKIEIETLVTQYVNQSVISGVYKHGYWTAGIRINNQVYEALYYYNNSEYVYGADAVEFLTSNVSYTNKSLLLLDASGFEVNGSLYTPIHNTYYSPGGEISLYGATDVSNVNNTNLKISAKIFYAKFYDGDVLIRSFVPCYSTTTVTDVNGNECEAGTIGMYDLVEGKFYTNQGNGIFLKGDDV